MLRRIRKILKYTLFSSIGFGFVGLVMGLMHNTDNGADSWLWVAGFTFIGAFAGGGLAFVIGHYKKIPRLMLSGALAGALTWWLISTSEIEPWLQMTALGFVAGAFLGLALGVFGGEKPKPADKQWECDECGWKIGKNDNYCPGCGVEFE